MIAQKLRSYLQSKGIKQSHVAKALDIPVATMNGMLRGKLKLPADTFFAICREIEVDPMDIVNREDRMQ